MTVHVGGTGLVNDCGQLALPATVTDILGI